MAGCLTTITNRASGNAPWRNRVITRLGGDFSTSTDLDRSQWGDHCSSRRAEVSGVSSGERSVRWAAGARANLPGPPWALAGG
jgi:hypothetical protein